MCIRDRFNEALDHSTKPSSDSRVSTPLKNASSPNPAEKHDLKTFLIQRPPTVKNARDPKIRGFQSQVMSAAHSQPNRPTNDKHSPYRVNVQHVSPSSSRGVTNRLGVQQNAKLDIRKKREKRTDSEKNFRTQQTLDNTSGSESSKSRILPKKTTLNTNPPSSTRAVGDRSYQKLSIENAADDIKGIEVLGIKSDSLKDVKKRYVEQRENYKGFLTRDKELLKKLQEKLNRKSFSSLNGGLLQTTGRTRLIDPSSAMKKNTSSLKSGKSPIDDQTIKYKSQPEETRI
eukprot:TRINITY_DN4740_c0_g1_i5.p1 TRINITY_DN4740_c0_g1~~TRINITY_DN4740_c0_g1_i5.p1  ORF type:complete len:287 (+),score=39.04 TRINITY_DN4740_c0_g1_i5:65-925(+)